MSDGFYREGPAARDLTGHVLRVWQRRIGHAEACSPIRVLPDGSMDLMWVQGELVIAGPDTTAWRGRLPEGAELAGVRFRPGVAPAILGIPAAELRNSRLSAASVSARFRVDLIGRLESGPSLAEATVLLQDVIRQCLMDAPAPDPAVEHAVTAIARARGTEAVRIDRLAEDLGLSERQLHRKCRVALGYGPKTLARITRFQRFVSYARRGTPHNLAGIASLAGYADQPHLTREVGRLAGVTPRALIATLAS